MALRNVVQRRNHKERSQLASRKHLGLLEKHKDYVQRAADHHSKRDRIKRLREKAGERNKDEFYFGMVNSQTKSGVHLAKRANSVALSTPLVQLLKTQDASLLRHQQRQEQKRLDKLIAKLAPAVPGMRNAWLDLPIKKDFRERTRRQVLEDAGLLKAKGKGKARDTGDGLYDDAEDESASGVVGLAGKKTIWCDSTDELRTYASTSAAAQRDADTMDDRPDGASDGAESDWNDLDDLDAGALEGEDDMQASRAGGAGQQDERHLARLLLLLSARQQRHAVLSEAAAKVGLARSLMATRGNSARNVTAKSSAKSAQMLDLVAAGQMTANGLALPGNEDEDERGGEDDDGTKGKSKLRIFKWSRERKR